MDTQHPPLSTHHPEVACLAVPNFLIALARREDPALHGRPVVTGGSPDEHARVTACSEEAAEMGVTVGATLRKALALCPGAVFLPLQEGLIAAEAARLRDHLALWSPVVEEVAPGHLHFEVRGLARMARMREEDWLADLHQAVGDATGLPVRLAAAETLFAAHAAASIPASTGKGGPILVSREAAGRFLASLPVEALPVPPLMHQRLRSFFPSRRG